MESRKWGSRTFPDKKSPFHLLAPVVSQGDFTLREQWQAASLIFKRSMHYPLFAGACSDPHWHSFFAGVSAGLAGITHVACHLFLYLTSPCKTTVGRPLAASPSTGSYHRAGAPVAPRTPQGPLVLLSPLHAGVAHSSVSRNSRPSPGPSDPRRTLYPPFLPWLAPEQAWRSWHPVAGCTARSRRRRGDCF